VNGNSESLRIHGLAPLQESRAVPIDGMLKRNCPAVQSEIAVVQRCVLSSQEIHNGRIEKVLTFSQQYQRTSPDIMSKPGVNKCTQKVFEVGAFHCDIAMAIESYIHERGFVDNQSPFP
jgi:hypothetical protein